jgi:hypothetical protein
VDDSGFTLLRIELSTVFFSVKRQQSPKMGSQHVVIGENCNVNSAVSKRPVERVDVALIGRKRKSPERDQTNSSTGASARAEAESGPVARNTWVGGVHSR